MTTGEQAFAAIGRRACPPLVDALIAVAEAWRPVDRADVDARLDSLARPLFTVGRTGEARARALAERMARAFRADAGPVTGLWLDTVLDLRSGHPALIAAVAAEVGRRAGWDVMVSSTPTAWYVGLLDAGRLWLLDPTGETAGAATPPMVRRHCAHEVAFVVLTGLGERFSSPPDAARARALRSRLALFAPPGHPGQDLLATLWTTSGAPR